MAILNLAVFSLALYPIISYLGRFPKVMEVRPEKKRRDTLEHDTYIYRDVNIDCYILGWLGEQWKYIIAASIMAWGFGDSMAALIGKAYGKCD